MPPTLQTFGGFERPCGDAADHQKTDQHHMQADHPIRQDRPVVKGKGQRHRQEHQQRARGRGELDRIEQAGLAFFERTRAKYLSLAKQDESIVVVSAMQPMEKVHQDVIAIINDYVTNTSSESQQGKG